MLGSTQRRLCFSELVKGDSISSFDISELQFDRNITRESMSFLNLERFILVNLVYGSSASVF